MLSNREKQPIYTALRDCIRELERLLVNSYELEARRNGTAIDPKRIEQGYQQLIMSINDAYSYTKSEEEKTNAFFDSPRHQALLKKPQNMLRVFFHPTFEEFSKFQLINHPLYTEKGNEVTTSEFDEKFPEIKKFILEQLEIIISKNKNLLCLKADIKCLNNDATSSNQPDKTGL